MRGQALLALVLFAVLVPVAGATAYYRAPEERAYAQAPDPPRSGVWYEIFVRAWYDTDGDGIGDLNGVTAKLDYLKSLGVDGIWLMPINPSPSYHGYDVTDYRAINPQYGTLADFQRLLAAAHARDIRVIMDLVVNHTSDRHPWFRAARDSGDPHHAWYGWAGAGTDLHAASATGGPAWHALGKQHYLGIFSGDMPDLDFDTPAVRKAVTDIGRYWLAQGVDGFRLDAARHVYEDFAASADDPARQRRNLAWWGAFHDAMSAVRPDVYLIGEVTRDEPGQLAPWFGPLDAVFDFPLATQLVLSARNERNDGLGELLRRIAAAVPAGQDAPFLSNHDQERVMSQLGGDASHMRTAAAMLLTLPGRPFIYYGEELGMRGRKPDPDLREPMRWHRDPHGPGESRWKRFSAGDGPEVSVEAQQDDGHSLLAWYRMLIGWRRELPVLRDGALSVPAVANPRLAVWELADAGNDVLVVHNLSHEPQRLKLAGVLARFGHIRLTSQPEARIAAGELQLPAYAAAILQ
ncbi:alpha-amylase family glycosyl hydrolase [Frateuria hangzhouensis]|uniref:alpha-amylase family glycosyl hydrolase n=1 Tax=Frateuria hangzhouensis TaxID=2995589 RepID=UPI002260953C|nr:alpha-amylase family glycosyl hydrolase [Frateuria sp. STR12]MCX7512278.1 alpha-amylase family glycosyl hydrolase [Frateuria sp. STR12]